MAAVLSWLPADLALLDDRCPLPLDRPFTAVQARAQGVPRARLSSLVRRGLVRPVVHGVYVAQQVVDSVELRAASLALVIPPSAVVTDRTAAWLHGVDILPRSSVHAMPPIEMFDRSGSRLRRPDVASGRRRMLDSDVTMVDGVQVTTQLRTALDLGRRLRGPDALAALDALLRAGVDRRQLASQVQRFRGERGVVQLRLLVPLADPRAESPAESVLRWHWMNTPGMPEPELQVWVHDDGYPRFRIDLGVPALRFGAEYDGRVAHGEDRRTHDLERRAWLDDRRWTILVFTDHDLYVVGADPSPRLQEGLLMARRRSGLWVPQGHYLHL